ncbi:MAG: homoserine kinase [Atribacterota bacterium]
MIFEVNVPATTANIGCGFDVLGMALDLYYRVQVNVNEDGSFAILHRGEGAETIPFSENHLLYRTVRTVWEKLHFPPVGFRVEAFNDIPVARGLGSSAACIVAGVTVANFIAGSVLSLEEMIRIACEIEGHPDNVLPAFLGGFTVAMPYEGKMYYRKFSFFPNAEIVLCVPQYGLSTAAMRKLLPETYPRQQVVFNLSHLAYLLGSLFEGDFDGFLLALEDYLHQPYRGKAIKGFFEVKEYVQRMGLGNAAISGSGPTVVLFLRRPLAEEEVGEIQTLFHAQGGGEVVLKRVQWVERGAVVKLL